MIVALICFLLQSGCNITKNNKKGVTPLQLTKKNQIFDILKDIPELLPRLEIRYGGFQICPSCCNKRAVFQSLLVPISLIRISSHIARNVLSFGV